MSQVKLTAIIRNKFYSPNSIFKKETLFLRGFIQILGMIQRIQTLYLILVAILSGILPFVFPLWQDESGTNKMYFMHDMPSVVLFGLSFTLSIVAILGYKKRQNQFVINRLNIILNLILLGLFVYRSLSLSGESELSEKGIGIFLPIGAIVCLVLANRGIKKDEELVKSVDRLR